MAGCLFSFWSTIFAAFQMEAPWVAAGQLTSADAAAD
jgi:hypothetical protein